jgi:hypothetical protein
MNKAIVMYKVKHWTNDKYNNHHRFSVISLVTESEFEELLNKGKVIKFKKKKIKF